MQSFLQCNPAVWYIAADFQLTILFYPIICLYYSRRRYLLYVVAISLSMAIYGGSLYRAYWFIPGMVRLDESYHLFNDPAQFEAFRLLYTNPGPHLLGYTAGALIAMKTQEKRDNLSLERSFRTQKFLHFLAIAALMIAMKAIFSTMETAVEAKQVFAFGLLYALTILATGKSS